MYKPAATDVCVVLSQIMICSVAVEAECGDVYAATCDQTCARISGNDTCTCSSAYTLGSDGTTCVGMYTYVFRGREL